ncbi:MAG: phenylacetate--CoA ligase family protein [Actinobacteria bacterium]|nr:phenylacetate--CoA ligase family protein [Actinomycetota bacterium]
MLETLTLEQMGPVHERLFLAQLAYAYERAEFYRDKFAEVGLELGDIGGLEDLPKVPFVSKDEIRRTQAESHPLGAHAAVDPDEVVRVYSSSGTSGVPIYVGLTANDLRHWAEVTARGQWANGIRPYHRVVLAVGHGGFFAAAAIKDAFEELGAMTIPIGPTATDRVIDAFRYLKADAILGTPSYVLYLLKALGDLGIEPDSLGLKRIVVGGEPGASDPAIRSLVEGSFGAPLLETMGIGEMMPHVWAECEHQSGMHYIAQGAVHIELIDPETEQPKPIVDGAEGELVYTALRKEANPLLRYRTRDHVIVSAGPCECGRAGFRIKCIGRTDDMLLVRGVNVYPSAVRDVVAGFTPAVSGAIMIELDAPGPAVEPPVQIKVELAGGAEPDEGLAGQIEATLRAKLIFRAEVEFVEFGSLPRSEYKGQLVRVSGRPVAN